MIAEAEGPLSLPGCFDGLSAKALQVAGFEGAFVSGYAVSAAMLGEPDLGLLYPPEVRRTPRPSPRRRLVTHRGFPQTLMWRSPRAPPLPPSLPLPHLAATSRPSTSQMARRVAQITSAIPDVNLLVDADTGGGGILNIKRTVRTLIRSGAKGIVIEDQVWPKRPGHMYNLEVQGMDEFAAYIAAARDEIGGDDCFLVARTDARATSAKWGLDDAITRANLYLDAGADAAFIEAPRSRAEMEMINEKVRNAEEREMEQN